MRVKKACAAALVIGGIAAGVSGAAALRSAKKSGDFCEHATEEGFEPSPHRLAKRKLVNRNNMQAVWDAKPTSYKVLKRGADIALSSAALVALSPILAATAIAIMVEDGRPVIYATPRDGRDWKPFKMFKFRSMCKDADAKLQALLAKNEQYGAAFKIEEDPRITKVGRFIRKTSIDELPQLVNIIMGDMSIVGPRPIQKAREFTPYEAQRLVAKPGLTCYWQVLGRSLIPWEDWVELDLDYIQDASIGTDARLIAQTFGSVARAMGAR